MFREVTVATSNDIIFVSSLSNLKSANIKRFIIAMDEKKSKFRRLIEFIS